MGNLKEVAGYTPNTINPAGYPGLHYTQDLEGIEYKSNIGGLAVVKFGVADVRGNSSNGYEIGTIENRRTYIVMLAPPIAVLPAKEFRTDEQASESIERSADAIAYIAQLAKANVITCEHGRLWGLFPEKFIAESLLDRGFEVPLVFPKLGGRNRIQKHAILLIKSPNVNAEAQ